MEKELVRSIFRWQRRRANGWGAAGKLEGGGVSFVQLFDGHLETQPHLHVLVPEGFFGGGTLVKLPPRAKGSTDFRVIPLSPLLGEAIVM